MNTTDSAIRITHIPTGIVVSIQDDRSQHRNRAQAMEIIKAKVYALRKAELDKERSDTRRSMIGTGDRFLSFSLSLSFFSLHFVSLISLILRVLLFFPMARSERIRTYNFPQDRVTDHRIGYSVTGIEDMMRGDLLGDFAEKLRHSYLKEQLMNHFS